MKQARNGVLVACSLCSKWVEEGIAVEQQAPELLMKGNVVVATECRSP